MTVFVGAASSTASNETGVSYVSQQHSPGTGSGAAQAARAATRDASTSPDAAPAPSSKRASA